MDRSAGAARMCSGRNVIPTTFITTSRGHKRPGTAKRLLRLCSSIFFLVRLSTWNVSAISRVQGHVRAQLSRWPDLWRAGVRKRICPRPCRNFWLVSNALNLQLKATFRNARAPNFEGTGLPAATEWLSPNRRNTRCWGRSRLAYRYLIGSQTPKCVIHRIGRKRRTMFLALGFVLLLLWLGGFFVFHVTAFFIHILLILAVVSIIFHFMRGAASAV